MDREERGGWVYIMTNRYRGTLYTGSTADLPVRITQHRQGRGSEFCSEHGLTLLVWAERFPTVEEAMAQEKRIKRWHRDWKFEMIEKSNPDWNDLFKSLLH